MSSTQSLACLAIRGTFLVAALLLAAGCGSRDIVPVSGRVTLEGQPLAGATVTFQPVHDAAEEAQAATGSVGRTDAQGRYRLRLVDPDREGARVGTHVVTITTASSSLPADDAAAPVGEHVPPRWRDGSQRFTVPVEGTATADFELSGD